MAHRLAPEAETELDEIWYFIAVQSGNPDVADRFIHSITDRFLRLAVYPYSGRRRDDLRTGLRSVSVGQYLIIYRIVDSDVLILHVAHGRRNLELLFGQLAEKSVRPREFQRFFPRHIAQVAPTFSLPIVQARLLRQTI